MSRNISTNAQLSLALLILMLSTQCEGCRSYSSSYFESRRQADLYELSIIHMNDFHARFLEINEQGWPCHRETDLRCFGGLPRTLTAARQLKSEIPNSIFLNAGDHYQGTAWYNIHKWNATVEFLNMLPHDVMTIGNHDFDSDIAGLVPFLENVNVPVVLSNVIMDDEPILKNLIQKSYVIEKGGRKIGVIGVVYQSIWRRTKVGNLWFLDEIESINEETTKLKEQGVDIFIVLSHCGIEIDKKIAANCPDVDVIVGGHSHTFLYSESASPPYDVPKDRYPVVVKQPDTNREVLVVQAFAFTKYLGVLSLWINKQGEVAAWYGKPLLLDESIVQDENMLARLEPYKKTVEEKGNHIVGRNRFTMRKPLVGNMVTDAMVANHVGRGDGNDWTYAAIAINYARAVKKPLNPGSITYNDLLMTLPFDDTWDVIKVQGKDLRQALEDSFSSSFWQGRMSYYSNLVWSGIDVVYDTSPKAVTKLVEIKVRCRKCHVPVYEDLDDDKFYRIVVPGFLAHNGGPSKLARNLKKHTVGLGDIEQLASFIGLMSPLDYEKDYRVYYCDREVHRYCGRNYRTRYPHQNIFPNEFFARLDDIDSFPTINVQNTNMQTND